MCVCVRVRIAQSCQILCDPTDCGPPGSSVHGIFQARIHTFPPPEDLPDPGFEPESLASPALAGGFFTTVLPGEPISLLTYCNASSSTVSVPLIMGKMVCIGEISLFF